MDEDLATFLSSPFHHCALVAYVEVWQESGDFPPDSEQVKRRANELFAREVTGVKSSSYSA